MSGVFFEELGLPVIAKNLGVGSGTHGEQTGAMLKGLEITINDVHPDWVLVYGDTNSTLAGALAGAKLNVPVAHVEAGLRSFNRSMPEEINRIVADSISTLLLVPTKIALDNLVREGVSREFIHQTGDVMLDAVNLFREPALRKSSIINRLNLDDKEFVMATVHRAENTADPDRLSGIIEGLKRVARDIPVVLPLHPRTRHFCEDYGIRDFGHVKLIEPIGFLDMICLELNAAVIATDSGGVQKEAFFHRVPCVTFRDETEWVELVSAGWNRLVAPVEMEVANAIFSAVGSEGASVEPYGRGDAAEKIANCLETLPAMRQ